MKKGQSIIRGLWIVLLFVLGCASQPQTDSTAMSTKSVNKTEHDSSSNVQSRALPKLTESSTLSDYLTLAALNNPGLEAAFNRWKAALEQQPQASSLPDPRFNYQYFIEEVETRVGAQRQSFGLAQMFPWFGKLDLRGDMATQAAHAAQQHYESAKLALFFEVKDAYYEYYYLARAIAVTGENVSLIENLEQVIRTRYKAATASNPDLIRVQVELGKLEDHLKTLQDLREPVASRLNAALNRPTQAEIPWPKQISTTNISMTDTELLSWLREKNPELKALDFEIEQQKVAIELAQKEYYPDVTLGVNYIQTADAIGAMHPSDSGKDPVVAMASINVPIWRDKYDAGVRQARYHYHSALQKRENQANTLQARLKYAWYHFRDAQRKIDLYANALVPKAEQALQVAESAFQAGQGSFTDLIDAQRILLEFQLVYERARTNHEQSLARLEMLVGSEIPKSGNETMP